LCEQQKDAIMSMEMIYKPSEIVVEPTRQPAPVNLHNALRHWGDLIAHRSGMLLALMPCLLVAIIGLTLLVRSWPVVSTIPLSTVLFSSEWSPSRQQFGMQAFIVGSGLSTLLALIMAGPPALLTAIYLAEYTSRRMRVFVKPVIDLLAGIPSVVYGLWGVLVIVPFVRGSAAPWFASTFSSIPYFANNNPSGYGLLAGGIVLALMVFPLIVSVTEEVLRAIPRDLRESTFALGATHWEVTGVVLRAARPGVFASIVLSFSRAFGETLAILMVIGNVPQIPSTLTDGASTISGLIANNYGEMMSVPLYDAALMGAALMLLAVVLVFNTGARLFLMSRVMKGQAQ
jgi:phosphate transport system permease protein